MSEKQQTNGNKGFDFGTALALGITLGLAIGVALGNGALGMSGGLLVATLANAYHERKQGKKIGPGVLLTLTGGLLLIILVTLITAS